MKWLKRGILFLIGIGLIYSVTVFFLILSGKQDTPTANPDSILILGAQVKGSTSENAYPSTVLKERLDTALPFIKNNPSSTVIVCGGKGTDEPDSEASVMANYLIEHGIPENQIILEGTSTRTKENIQNAQKKQTLGNTVIVTSDFHMYRSKLLAKRLGIDQVSGLPAASHSSATVKSFIREVVALGYGLIFDH